MAADFDFSSFKQKIHSPTGTKICTWSQILNIRNKNEQNAGCVHPRSGDDIEAAVKWLVKYPEASSLVEIPAELFTNVFCAEHQIYATQITSDESKKGRHVRSDRSPSKFSSMTDQKPGRFIRFGSGERDSSPFAFPSRDMELPTISFDHQWGDSGVEVEHCVSKCRLLGIFHRDGEVLQQPFNENGENNKAQDVKPEPTADNSSHVKEEVKASFRPATPEVEKKSRDDGGDYKTSCAGTHRLSISPELIPRSNFRKSPSRERSPPKHDLPNLAVAFATMKGDASFDYPVQDNEQSVITLLQKPFRYTDKKSFGVLGRVYAIRDPGLDLVKIGFTKNEIRGRYVQIRNKCELSKTVHVVEDAKNIPVLAYKRLEELIHADLAPHRWYFHCECGLERGKKLTEHHEWYQVTDDVAIRTIRIWTDFIRQNPYGPLKEGQANELQPEWVNRAKSRGPVLKNETHFHHNTRLRRWSKLFTPKEQEEPATAGPQSTLLDNGANPERKQGTDKRSTLPSFDQPVPSIETPQDSSRLSKPTTDSNAAFLKSRSCPPKSAWLQDSDSEWRTPTEARASAPVIRVAAAQGEENRGRQRHSSEDKHMSQNKAATSVDGGQRSNSTLDKIMFTGTEFTQLLKHIDQNLRKEKGGLPSRSIYNDLIAFRWPLACMMIFGWFTPYVPPSLSLMAWCVLLPVFVAELREWS